MARKVSSVSGSSSTPGEDQIAMAVGQIGFALEQPRIMALHGLQRPRQRGAKRVAHRHSP